MALGVEYGYGCYYCVSASLLRITCCRFADLTVRYSDSVTKAQGAGQEIDATLEPSQVLERWIFCSEVAAGRGTFTRGLYDYAATASPIGGGKSEIHLVDYQLTLTHDTIAGSFTDAVGKGMVTGRISESGRRVRFIKQYTKHIHGTDLPRWQYEGNFTSHGIAGEWHYPGDPPALAIHRGRFAIWLQEDEDEQADDAQLTSLLESGKIMTRSMTFGR